MGSRCGDVRLKRSEEYVHLFLPDFANGLPADAQEVFSRIRALIDRARTMERFRFERFSHASSADRLVLCTELAKFLSEQLCNREFDSVVAGAVEQLRALGHDLVSYDQDENFESWGPSYADARPIRTPGIVVDFRRGQGVEVEWGGD